MKVIMDIAEKNHSTTITTIISEEILSSNSAVWFAPSSSSSAGGHAKLVYATFDDSNVGEVTYSEYGGGGSSFGSSNYAGVEPTQPPLYPVVRTIRYPKAGTENPSVRLRLVTDPTRPTKYGSRALSPPESILADDYYLSSVKWINADDVAVVWLNRAQNMSVVARCAKPQYKCKEVRLFGARNTAFSQRGKLC